MLTIMFLLLDQNVSVLNSIPIPLHFFQMILKIRFVLVLK